MATIEEVIALEEVIAAETFAVKAMPDMKDTAENRPRVLEHSAATITESTPDRTPFEEGQASAARAAAGDEPC